MNFEEKIEQSLKVNSEWSGSADSLWKKIQVELPRKTPWWQKQQVWYGTAAAAVLVLALFLKVIITPLPPEPIPFQPAETPQPQTFSVQFMPDQLKVEPNAKVSLSFTAVSLSEPALEPLVLTVTELPTGELVSKEITLTEEAFNEQKISVRAPEQKGTYRLVLQGIVSLGSDVYSVYGEQEIIVERGREE